MFACVTGTQNTAVTWSVNGTAGGDVTDGFITPGGVYTAPPTAPGAITITATSSPIPPRTALSPSPSAPPASRPSAHSRRPLPNRALSSRMSTSKAPTFFTTSNVLVNGSVDANEATTFISSTTLRARIFAPLLTSTAPIGLSVQSQCPPDCSTSNVMSLNVIAVRPGLISESPVNVPQSSPGTTSVT